MGSGGRSYLVDTLCVLFGIGTWVVVNGLWVELPLLVQAMPEGWSLPSYLTIAIQLANIAPLLYTLLHSVYPQQFTETRVIYAVISFGLIANGFLIFYWDRTGVFLGANRSTALLGLSFCLAMVDTSSRVLYLPFMARFQGIYLTSFFIGEGLSGFVPSIFALIQGVGGNPECRWVNITTGNLTQIQLEPVPPVPFFSVDVFFGLLFLTVTISLLAFHLLRNESLTGKALHSPTETERSPTEGLLNFNGRQPREPPSPRSYRSTSPTDEALDSIDPVPRDLNSSPTNNNQNIEDENDDGPVEFDPIVGAGSENRRIFYKAPLFLSISKPAFVYLLIVQGLVCALANGVFPSIQSFSSLPYGNVAYHWSVTLSTMANPGVCFLLFILPKPTKTSITSILISSVGVGIYVMTTAVKSPYPPLVGELLGEILLVLAWILLVGSFTYVKVGVATLLRSEGKRGLFWCGAITQLGSALGALVMFVIVNQTNFFKSYNSCEGQGGNVTTSTTTGNSLHSDLEGNLLV